MKGRLIATRIWDDLKFRELNWLGKFLFLHLLLRKEMTTIGAITLPVESIVQQMNQESGRNRVPGVYPKVRVQDIRKVLAVMEKKQMIATQNSGMLTVYFYHFLDHNRWTKNVFMHFPEIVSDLIPEGPIQEVVKLRTIGWMEEHGVEIPEEWR